MVCIAQGRASRLQASEQSRDGDRVSAKSFKADEIEAEWQQCQKRQGLVMFSLAPVALQVASRHGQMRLVAKNGQRLATLRKL